MLHCDPTTLALAALGEDISPDDAAHLESCEQCLADTAELIEVVTLGREAPAELPEVPNSIWSGIAAELLLQSAPDGRDATVLTMPAPRVGQPEDPAAAAPPATVTPLAPRRRSPVLGLGIAAAVGALVGGAVVWAAAESGGSDPQQPQGSIVAQTALDPLTPEVTQSGQAKVLDSPDGQVIRVDATALPPVEGYYEVWLIDEQVSGMVALGALPAGSIGTFTVPPGVSIEDFPIVDISLEPLDGDPAHSKVSLLRGVLET
jgi:hypothetical protein